MPRSSRIYEWLMLALFWLALGTTALALPSQEITIALPSGSYTKTTLSKTYAGATPFGFAGEYALFVSPNVCLSGQFELNLEPTEQSAVLLGGAGGLKYYPIGGDSRMISDPYVKGASWPKWNLFLLLGFGGKQYDFSVPEKAEQAKSEGLIVQKDAKDLQKGSAIGLSVGAGISIPLVYDLQVGLRAQVFQSFAAENQPDISVTSLWLSVGFTL